MKMMWSVVAAMAGIGVVLSTGNSAEEQPKAKAKEKAERRIQREAAPAKAAPGKSQKPETVFHKNETDKNGKPPAAVVNPCNGNPPPSWCN
jgi:hypothetical protein